MQKLILLCVSFFIATILDAQTPTFQKTYGGYTWELGQSVCQLNDGGYITSGRTSSYGHGEEDAYMIRVNADGDTLWTEELGGPLNDYGYTVRIAPDGGYLVSGHTESFGHGDCDGWMFKLDSTGKLMWMNTYGTALSEVTSSFNFTNDNGYILIGYHGTESDSTGWVYMVKTDINGDTLWTKHYGTAVSSMGYYVCQTADSGYVFTGYSAGYAYNNMDMILGRTDKNGNLRWLKTYGGDSNDEAYSMVITPDGGFIIAGYTHSFGAGDDDGYVIRTDAEGNTVWAKTYGGTKQDRFNHIEPTIDGGYILSGQTKSYGAGGADVYVVKIDSAGNQQWMQTYGDQYDQVNGSIKQCADSGYVIIGSSSKASGDYDELLIKTDKNGDMVTSIPGIIQNSYTIKAYPNPFTQSTSFNIPEGLKINKVSLTLYDVTGKNIFTRENISNENTVTIEKGNLLPGTYFYTFSCEGKIFSNGKILLTD